MAVITSTKPIWRHKTKYKVPSSYKVGKSWEHIAQKKRSIHIHGCIKNPTRHSPGQPN